MNILVPIDVFDGAIGEDVLGVCSKAASIGGKVAALLCGPGAVEQIASVAEHGASRIFVAEDQVFAEPLAGPRVALIGDLCARHAFDLLLAPTTTITCDVMAALASRLEAGLVWGLSDIEMRDEGALVGHRPAQNDSVVAEVLWTGAPRIGLFRPYALAAEPRPVANPQVEIVSPVEAPALVRLENRAAINRNGGPSLAAADVVVAGGRGLGAAEHLEKVRELATLLGGALGVSLPLVEMGWAPRSQQVGQTGTVIRPRLYVACGISGQIQHRVGMERSGTIIAINADPTAPIMGFCDLAVVGDATKIVPDIVGLLRERGLSGGIG